MHKLDPRFPLPTSLVHVLKDAQDLEPETTALICEDRSITYREFGKAVNNLAAQFEPLGVAGGRIALLIPNSIETVVTIIGVMAAHAQVAPVNPYFTEHELIPILKLCEAQVLVCDASTAAKGRAAAAAAGIPHVLVIGEGDLALTALVQNASGGVDDSHLCQPDDPALLIFTGGTTGIPKGVDHTHRGLGWSLVQHCSVWPVNYGKERFLTVTPMFHIWGLGYASWVPMYARSTLVIVPKYEPDTVVAALADHRITIFGGGPAPIYIGLLRTDAIKGVDLSALKYCLSGGAPCPEELHRRWHDLTGCGLLEGWGMTEGAPFCLNPYDGVRKILSVGMPVPETVVDVVDVETGTQSLPVGQAGEFRVRGPQVTKGYHHNPEETALAIRDGWLHTGDIGYKDDDGYYFIVDRKKEMIIVGGYNVYPRQVDEVLFSHPKIQEAAAVGKADPELGEAVAAFVVLKHGETMSEQEFFDFCKKEMVKYKRPVEVHFIDALPRTGANKINKLQLKQRLKDNAG